MNLVSQALLEMMVIMEMMELQEIRETLDLKEFLAKVSPATMETKENLEFKVTMVLLVSQEQLVQMVPRESQDQTVNKELLVTQAIKEYKVLQGLAAIVVHKEKRDLLVNPEIKVQLEMPV